MTTPPSDLRAHREQPRFAASLGRVRGRVSALILGGGTDGNEQLTGMTGLVLVLLLAVIGVTILRKSQLISVHLFVGLLLNAIFADHDVLLTPVTAAQPEPVAQWQGRGVLRTFNGSGPYVTYTAIWNYLGQPAAAVPAGFDTDGLPMAVQIVARPGGETVLLSLAAQLERERPWADRRPPVS